MHLNSRCDEVDMHLPFSVNGLNSHNTRGALCQTLSPAKHRSSISPPLSGVGWSCPSGMAMPDGTHIHASIPRGSTCTAWNPALHLVVVMLPRRILFLDAPLCTQQLRTFMHPTAVFNFFFSHATTVALSDTASCHLPLGLLCLVLHPETIHVSRIYHMQPPLW